MKNIFIGIDVSSKTLDLCLKEGNEVTFFKIENSIKDIKSFFKKLTCDSSVYVGMENTGRYNLNLYEVLESFSFMVFVINPLHLKKSLGITRGKNDIVDAERIALFIEKNHTELAQWKPNSTALKKIKILQSERNHRVKIKTGLLKQQKDYPLVKSFKLDKELLKLNKDMISNIDKQIKAIEAKIETIIEQDLELNEQAKRLQSIPGVGKVLTWMMLSKTQGFTTINDPRKMACYAGVVPFEHQSGTSLKYKPKVSIYADRELKSKLHLAAMSAIRLDNSFRKYYLRKIEEGKNKMSILNAIRNKIIHVIFAVIKNQKNYQTDLVMS